MSTSPARPRLAALDGLRLVAALAVLAFHYVGVDVPYWGVPSAVEFPGLNELARYGYLGVNVFFAISGFVILMTAYGRSIESFTASRVARLFPAYWAVVVMTAVLQQFWTEGRNPTWVDALVNLTMTQEAYDVVNVQGAFWTLWIELKFYLLIAAFVLVGMTRARVLAFAVLWPLLGRIAAVTDSGFLNSLLIPTYAPYFAAGMVLYLLHRERHDTAASLALLLNAVLCVRQAASYADRASELVGAPVSPLVAGLVVVVGLLAILVCSAGVVSRVSWRWLTFAGALTYPLYLVHGQLGFFLIDTLQSGMGSYQVLAVATAASLVLAYLVHVAVEKPFSGPLRRRVLASLADQKTPD